MGSFLAESTESDLSRLNFEVTTFEPELKQIEKRSDQLFEPHLGLALRITMLDMRAMTTHLVPTLYILNVAILGHNNWYALEFP